ncbi:MAG: tetratricopeptide repeat protein [Candidatus Andersenbacteria bacterium]|nr:tetratricopeptide repeat protein [Candidatus Andersenbacteria bacterium]
MTVKENFNKERKIIIIAAFVVFLLLFSFYKWQLITSSGYLFLGDEGYKSKDYDESLKNYKYAAVIGGNRNTTYLAKLKRSEIFYSHGLLNEAEKELKMAIKEIKNDFRAYEVMGDVYYSKRNISGSISYYEKALELKDKEEINIKLAKSFIAEGNIGKANDIFLKLYSENDHNNEISYYLGLLDFYKNESYNDYFQEVEKDNDEDYEEKISKIKKHLDNRGNIKNEIYGNVLIANLYNTINEPYLAIGKSELAIEENPDYRDAFLALGKSNFIIGDYKESYESFNKALELDSHNPEIIFWLGSVYQKLEDESKAEEFMDKYRALISE